MQRHKAAILGFAAATIVGLASWLAWTAAQTKALMAERGALRSVVDALAVYGHQYKGQLPPDLEALSIYYPAAQLSDIRAMVIMDPDLTIAGLLSRRDDLLSSSWQPIRLRHPKFAGRADCSANPRLLLVLEQLVKEFPDVSSRPVPE
ncbi:MAG: hypothetical protein JNL80_16655 [Phycisphaerae bacterium]|nr:hypothetical protein [Phycisphaerae bacterium]